MTYRKRTKERIKKEGGKKELGRRKRLDDRKIRIS